jgi:hypothetical protein
MGLFREKAIFLWCYWDISLDPKVVADRLVEGGFEAVYVHTNDGYEEGSYARLENGKYVTRLNCTPELVTELKSRGLKVYGWGAPYGRNVVAELAMMITQTQRYDLDGYVIDAEGTWDAHLNAVSDTRLIITEYKKACPGKPVAWCWWPLFESSTGVSWHPVAILREAMRYADVGMPMAYWEGSTAAQAVAYLNRTMQLWRRETSKPIVPAGRSWTGDGGEATRAAVLAFEQRARELGAVGVTWWDLQHAVKLPACWQALKETPKFTQTEEPKPMVDWTKNAVGLFTKTAGWTNKDFDFIVGYAGGDWSWKNGLLVLEPNSALYPIEKQAHLEGKPFLALWDMDVDWYRRQQIDARDEKWPSEANDYPLQRLIAALTSRDVDGLIVRVMNRKNFDKGDEMMSYVAFAARKFIERANKWLYSTKGLSKWTFVLTNDDFMRIEGAQESFYSWLKNWYVGIEHEATKPLANGAWPQATDAIKAIPPSQGWKFWYHHNTTALDMMIYNGDETAMRTFLGYGATVPQPDTTPPGVPTGLAAKVTGGTITLSWVASTDGPVGYQVWQGGARLAAMTVTTAVLPGTFQPGQYTFGVSAFDAAGNESAQAVLAVTVPEVVAVISRAEFEALAKKVEDALMQLDGLYRIKTAVSDALALRTYKE